MTKQVKVASGYIVPPQYITLEDGEELCPNCNGTRKTVIAYMHDSWRYGTCMTCGGTGKIYHCKECGAQHPGPMIRHEEGNWMDGMCFDCIVQDDRFEREKKLEIIDETFHLHERSKVE